MRQFCLLSFSVCLIFTILIYPANCSNLIMQTAADLVNSTCKQCSEQSTISSYEFCVSSLQAIPISHAVNLPGLAIVAMELATDNATITITTIKKMIESKAFDPFAKECLIDCLELYESAVSMVKNAIIAFLSEHFDAAKLFMSTVMEDAATCEEGFREKEGEVTPLVKENDNLFELSSVALCIIELVSSKLPFLTS